MYFLFERYKKGDISAIIKRFSVGINLSPEFVHGLYDYIEHVSLYQIDDSVPKNETDRTFVLSAYGSILANTFRKSYMNIYD